MSEVLNNPSYDMSYDNLLASTKHSPDVNIVNIASGQGTVVRGTVLCLTSEDKYIVMGSDVDEGVTYKANCIVSDTVDTGTEAGDEVPVCVYVSGHMNSKALIVAESYTLSDDDKENLRLAGLYISSSNAI